MNDSAYLKAVYPNRPIETKAITEMRKV